MTGLARIVPAAVGLCSAILLTAQDCGQSVNVVQRFQLPICPSEGFALPDSALRAPYRLTEVHERTRPERSDYGYALCPGFRIYHLRENNSERGYYRVRLNGGPSCSLDVGYGYVGSRKGSGRLDWLEVRTKPWVEVVAQLLVQDSTMAASIPAPTTEAFSDEAFTTWCVKQGDHSHTDSPSRLPDINFEVQH